MILMRYQVASAGDMPTRWSCRGGWTLDDLRDPELHLFRPPRPSLSEPTARAGSPRSTRHPQTTEQLQFGVDHDVASTDADSNIDIDGSDDGAVQQDPWAPSFDEADDLGGLLSASSPLLARAFRTAGRDRQ